MSLELSDEDIELIFRMVAADMAGELWTAADELDEHSKNIKIARISGSSVSILGGGAAIAGVALAPLTGGLSLIATAIGTGFSVAGGLTSGGSEMTGLIIQDRKKAKLKKIWRTFQKVCQQLFPKGSKSKAFPGSDRTKRIVELMTKAGRVALGAGKGIHSTVESGKSAADAVKAANAAKAACGTSKCATAAEATAVAGGVVKGISKTTVALGAVGIAISVYDVVTASVDLHKKKKCPVGEQLRQLAKELDELARN